MPKLMPLAVIYNENIIIINKVKIKQGFKSVDTHFFLIKNSC